MKKTGFPARIFGGSRVSTREGGKKKGIAPVPDLWERAARDAKTASGDPFFAGGGERKKTYPRDEGKGGEGKAQGKASLRIIKGEKATSFLRMRKENSPASRRHFVLEGKKKLLFHRQQEKGGAGTRPVSYSYTGKEKGNLFPLRKKSLRDRRTWRSGCCRGQVDRKIHSKVVKGGGLVTRGGAQIPPIN